MVLEIMETCIGRHFDYEIRMDMLVYIETILQNPALKEDL